ncbi:MAG: DNA polymerase I [Actinobacteria bacterium]|nr:DNA polymerase I [Actinomycetota bacterium]
MNKSRIILVDSNNIAYRAFYALPQTIMTSTGQITNAVYGFTSMLIKIIEDKKPDVIICAFDSKGPTFRHAVYDGYKATRKKMPDELSNQISLLKEVASVMNIQSIEVDGYEADDIIATLARKCSKSFDEVIILSSDKDILQLVSGNIKVLALKKGITDTFLFNSSEVENKFGVEPERIKDLLALMGDSSDNIPGIPGIGPKTAADLLNKFKTVKGIYEYIDDLTNEKLKNLLLAQKEAAFKSLELTELKDDLDIDFEQSIKNRIENINIKKTKELFTSLEFNTLKKRLENILKAQPNQDKYAEVSPVSSQDFKKVKNHLKKIRGEIIFNNIDSSKILNLKSKKIFISLMPFMVYRDGLWTKEAPSAVSVDGLNGRMLAIKDDEDNFYIFISPELGKGKSAGNLAELLENSEIAKSGFGFKAIYKYLEKLKINMCGDINDYKLQYLLLDPDMSKITLSEIFSHILDPEISRALSAVQSNAGNMGLNKGQLDNAGQQSVDENADSNVMQMDFGFDEPGANSTDAAEIGKKNTKEILEMKNLAKSGKIRNMPFLINMLYFPELDNRLHLKLKDEGLESLYRQIEAPLVKVLADMEYKGVGIDRPYLDMLIKQYDKDIKELTGQIHELCNENFNINSTQQLAKILYEKMNLNPTKKTKSGYSTDAAALLAIKSQHPVIEKILDYREKVKLKNTYIDVLPGLIDPCDGRVHTTYNQLGTTTGRISSNNPNLQNIPVRTELGRQIRKAFIPGTGYDLLLSADYSQIELRILAHLSEDRDLIDAFKSGMDIHAKTAVEIFNVDYDDINEDLRRKAKAINFGILYGMTEFGLKARLSISEEEARQYINLYFSRYPDVKKYINKLISQAYKTGYATTMFGRKRYIKELFSSNANLRNLGERLAVNTPVQGSAADIMKLATVVLFNRINDLKLDCNLIFHVHDEIVLELKEKDLLQVKEAVLNSMETCVDLKTGLKVDIKTGKNWFI